MGLRSIHRQCEIALRDVPVPSPFVLETFCDVISERRGRRLHLIPKQTPLGPCGIWLALPDGDYVFFEPETTRLHRQHIILHELGHLLCEHEPHEMVDGEVLARLFPSVDPSVVRRVLARTTYSTVEEQQAEVMASLVQERADRAGLDRSAWSLTGGDAALARVEAALDSGRRTGHG